MKLTIKYCYFNEIYMIVHFNSSCSISTLTVFPFFSSSAIICLEIGRLILFLITPAICLAPYFGVKPFNAGIFLLHQKWLMQYLACPVLAKVLSFVYRICEQCYFH